MRFSLANAFAIALCITSSPDASELAAPDAKSESSKNELPRQVMFGASLAPVTEEVREKQKLKEDCGVTLTWIHRGTSAADADFKVGDVITAVDGDKVTDVKMFLARIEQQRAGSVLKLDVLRNGEAIQKRVTLKEKPLEKGGDGYDVIYSSVKSHGARLRTIITRPKTEGPHAAVLMLQGGATCFPIDNAVGPPNSFMRIARGLAQLGYVTMRVERPECGDSEGGPLRDADLETELDGNKQALRALKQLDFVDADNVFLFGHSSGGVMAPLMAVDVPVRGIATYGTASGTWFESVVIQRRRLAKLNGTDVADVDGEVIGHARLWYPLLVQGKTPAEIRKQDPELPESVWKDWVKDDKYVAGRHYKYHHQLASKNLADLWRRVVKTDSQPQVLSIWGTTDWLSTREACSWVAEVCNRSIPGSGKFIAFKSTDHFFFHADTNEKSFRHFKADPPGTFNPLIVRTLQSWIDENTVKTEPKNTGFVDSDSDAVKNFLRANFTDKNTGMVTRGERF